MSHIRTVLKSLTPHPPQPGETRGELQSHTSGRLREAGDLIYSNVLSELQRPICCNPLPFEGGEIVIFSSQRLLQSRVAHYLIGFVLHSSSGQPGDPPEGRTYCCRLCLVRMSMSIYACQDLSQRAVLTERGAWALERGAGEPSDWRLVFGQYQGRLCFTKLLD